MRRIY